MKNSPRTTWNREKNAAVAKTFHTIVRPDGTIPSRIGMWSLKFLASPSCSQEKKDCDAVFRELHDKVLAIDAKFGFNPTSATALNMAMRRFVNVATRGIHGTNPSSTDFEIFQETSPDVQ